MRNRALWALVGLSGGTFLYTMAEGMPVGVLLPMAADLSVSPPRIGLLVTVYAAIVMLASVPLTVLVRRVPRRLLLTVLLASFVASTAITAFASTYAVVLAARLVTAATHAVFWAVVVPAAAGLFPPRVRGRVVAVVFAGGTVALALGLPAGTWLGERADWRLPFLAIAGFGALVLLIVASQLPSSPPDAADVARGDTPDPKRFWLLVSVSVLTTAGAMVAYTYVTLFVTEVSGIAPSFAGAVLLARGIASVLGVLAMGFVVDRGPWLALGATVGIQSVALLALYAFGGRATLAITLIALTGLTFAGFTTALGGLVLRVAPGRPDIAAATTSAAVNVGIAAGSFLGGLAQPTIGVRSTALIGATLGFVALAVVVAERLLPALADTASTGPTLSGSVSSSMHSASVGCAPAAPEDHVGTSGIP